MLFGYFLKVSRICLICALTGVSTTKAKIFNIPWLVKLSIRWHRSSLFHRPHLATVFFVFFCSFLLLFFGQAKNWLAIEKGNS